MKYLLKNPVSSTDTIPDSFFAHGNMLALLMEKNRCIYFVDENNDALRQIPYGVAFTNGYYIQDGLVFHLDGYSKDTDAQQWTDLIGGHTFTNHNAVAGPNYWYFGNTRATVATAYMTCSDTLGFLSTNCTIEVCYESEDYENYYALFIQKTSNGIIYGTNGKGSQYIISVGTNQQTLPNTNVPGTYTCSFNTNFGVKNLTKVNTTGTPNRFGTVPSTNAIGYTPGATEWAFRGKIYSIRIYNRKLDVAEMMHNQKYDIVRFGLSI